MEALYFLSLVYPMVQAEHPADRCSHGLQSLGGLRYVLLSLTSTEPGPGLQTTTVHSDHLFLKFYFDSASRDFVIAFLH